MVMSHIKLNGITNAATCIVINISCPRKRINSQDNAFSLLHVCGANKRQMMLFNFLIIFYYLMLNQMFPGLSTKIFRILHKLDENHHLNSSCRSQS